MSKAASIARGVLEAAAHVVVGAILLIAFFRILPLTRFDAIPGDQGDMRDIISTLEHWWNVYQGKASLLSPPVFYPLRGVLGYSDALFLFTPFFAAIRALGVDMFLAYQVSLIALGVLGYAGCLLLLRSFLGLNPVVAAVGSAVYMFSNAQFLALNHTQLLAGTAFLPYLSLLALAYARRLNDPSRYIIGVALCLLFGLVAFTSFYIAWYFAAFALVAVLVAATMAVISHGRAAADAAASWFRRNVLHLGVMAAAMALALVPFIITYAPILATFGRRSFDEVATMLPMAADYLNVSYYNALWGGLLEKMLPWLDQRANYTELRFALTPILMLVFLGATAIAVGRLTGRLGDRKQPSAQEQLWLAVVLGISVLICLVLMVRVSDSWSPWFLVYDLVPGGSAIRAVYRFNLALALPVVIVVGIVLSRLVASGQPWPRRVAGYAILALLLIEQANGHMPHFSKSEQRENLARIVTPPTACKSFYLLPDQSQPAKPWAWQQTDATLIALAHGIPTLHGLKAWEPHGWELRDPLAEQYPTAVINWIRQHKLPSESVCGLVQSTGQWFLAPPPHRYPWRE